MKCDSLWQYEFTRMNRMWNTSSYFHLLNSLNVTEFTIYWHSGIPAYFFVFLYSNECAVEILYFLLLLLFRSILWT